ncbi:non-contractile tail sheath protein [Xanthobacter flavus]|uniref:non-contractile tail sheath protein n=1 Tax=Xanthobacter flavus TaxID=281 RepID=UPI0037277B75
MSLLAKAPGPQDGSILRFDPAYWQIDFNIQCAASLVTAGDRALKLSCTFRTDKDLVGLIWHSVDAESHQLYRYATDTDYRGCVLRFDFRLKNLLPLDHDRGLVLTAIENNEAETPYYVRLENYRIAGTPLNGRVLLDFSSVQGGFNLPAEAVTIPWHNIKRFFIGVIPPAYVPLEDNAARLPIEEVEATLELYNIFCTGSRTSLSVCTAPQAAHGLRIADGLDDAYHLTPQRIVDGVRRLGYRGWYVLYLGITHMHQVSWDAGEARFVVDPGKPVLNAPTQAWLTDLFMRLAGTGFRIVVSLSYEILKSVCPSAWMQRAWNDAPAQTGWEPPSTLIAPTNTAGLDYLAAIFGWCMDTLKAMGAPLFFQVGEPWWWDGTYTDGSPCIYDAGTRALFTAETGFAVPTPFLQSSFDPVGPHGPYLSWLRDKLGASTLYLRDHVKAAHPDATSLILIFTPQVLNPAAPILEVLNFPYRAWRSPAWDMVQLEDYDWIITGEWTLHSGTLAAGTGKLGYSLDRLHFFGGFNLLADTADTIWPRIDEALNDGFQWGVAETYVWARPQVWRDGFVWQASAETDACSCGCADYEGGPIRSGGFSFIPAPGTGGDPVPPYEEPGDFDDVRKPPADLQMVSNSFGDVRFSWSPNGEDPGEVSYTLTIYDPTAGTAVRTVDIVTPTVVDGRVRFDYPVELSAADFGFAPTFLVWRVATNGEAAAALSGAVPIDNAAIVKRAVMFCGQSNALGHFTTLSGATLAQGSAAAFRRALAGALGLSHVEVIPVQAAWGSSAADRWADDNPSSGTNYWWDLDAGISGPRLSQAIAIGAGLGVPVSAIIWAQGENDASATSAFETTRHSDATRFRTAMERIFTDLRAGLGNAALPIWIQTLGRAFYGAGEPPPEPIGATYKAYRDVQLAVAVADPNIRIGSWVPGAEDWHNYVAEMPGPGRIHYLAPVYQTTAAELADAVAHGLDRAGAPPAWTQMAPPAATPSAQGQDATVTWPATDGATFSVVNLNVMDGSQIGTTTVVASGGAGTWHFTAAEQIAAYGFAGGYVNVILYEVQSEIMGPSVQLVFDIAALSSGQITLASSPLAIGGDLIVMEA